MKPVDRVPLSATLRPFTVIAQDPTVIESGGEIVTTQLQVPAEQLLKGPWGYRIQVVDYDATTGKYYQPWDFEEKDAFVDPYAGKKITETVLRDPRFHAQNVYAIAMKTLARFEFAFGRRVAWRFPTHQLKIAPHAFRDANAYYDRRSESLQFGYFAKTNSRESVFTCLSHDVVAHETTHAILDGLHEGYFYPSGPDQAAFHEAFSDIIALLSVFSIKDVVAKLLDQDSQESGIQPKTIAAKSISMTSMRKSLLLGLAEQFGTEVNVVRGSPLRQSLAITPNANLLNLSEFQEPHRRGEVLVAAMLSAFLRVFDSRVKTLDASGSGLLNRERVVEEAAKTAEHLITIAIRALDYAVPIHLTFGSYLSALLTSDAELVGNDSTFHYRQHLRTSFAEYGISPDAESGTALGSEPGIYDYCQPEKHKLNYHRAHFGSFQTDPEEVFRFLWENRKSLGIQEDVYTRVVQVRPCIRISPEGFPLRETIVQYTQVANVKASELSRGRFSKIERPKLDSYPMPASARVTLRAGGTLVFDQYGQLKFNIATPINDPGQSILLEELWRQGYFRDDTKPSSTSFRQIHRMRSLGRQVNEANGDEGWL